MSKEAEKGKVLVVACCSGDCCPKVIFYKNDALNRQIGITDDFGQEVRMSKEQYRIIKDTPVDFK